MSFRCPAYYTVSTVRQCLRSVLTGLSKPQLENLSLLTFGLFAAGNCQLPRIAVKLPTAAYRRQIAASGRGCQPHAEIAAPVKERSD